MALRHGLVEDRLLVSVTAHSSVGFARKPKDDKGGVIPPPPPPPRPPAKTDTETSIPLKLDAALEVGHSWLKPEEKAWGGLVPSRALSEEDRKAEARHPEAAWEPLVPYRRLIPKLRGLLSEQRKVGIDVEALIASKCAGQLPRKLPARLRTCWSSDAVVYSENRKETLIHLADRVDLLSRMRKVLPHPEMQVRTSEAEWIANIPMGRVGRVVIVSDLGLAPGTRNGDRVAIHGALRKLLDKGVEVVALCPVGEAHVGPLPLGLEVVRWSSHGALAESHTPCVPQHETDRIDATVVLSCISAARWVSPPLVRALCRTLCPGQDLAGLELEVWNHSDFECLGGYIRVRPEARKQWWAQFVDLTSERKIQAAWLIFIFNHEEDPEARWIELLQLKGLLLDLIDSESELGNAVEWSADRFAAFADSVEPEQFQSSRHQPFFGYALDLMNRGIKLRDTVLRGVLDNVKRALSQGYEFGWKPPEWIEPEELASVSGSTGGIHHRVSIEYGWSANDNAQKNYLILNRASSSPDDSSLLSFKLPSYGAKQLRAGQFERWVHASESRAGQIRLDVRERGSISSHSEQVEWKVIQRPRGVHEWRFRKGKLDRVVMPDFGVLPGDHFVGIDLIVSSKGEIETSGATQYRSQVTGKPWIQEFGLDEYGAFSEIKLLESLNRQDDSLCERIGFRYMEPGQFLMGSPENEVGRFSEETQHWVTLTKGFWISDTVCSRGLWKAVMGKYPSNDWDGDDLPATGMSRDEIRLFLKKLEDLIPGTEASLPTEAEWEYACRAGRTTPYWWGDEPSSERMNCRDSKGREPLPVKSLEPSPWGLYQMHGNVWEWCDDSLREFQGDQVVDPHGGSRGSTRVLRGGSWLDGARSCRSASRLAYPRDDRIFDLGFRFCLRSTSEPGSASAD